MSAEGWRFSETTSSVKSLFVSSGKRRVASDGESHFPSFVMAIGTTSYLSASIASITARAERTETSCSPERPPKITPTRSFFINKFQVPSFKFQVKNKLETWNLKLGTFHRI